jgi:small subunit ribosomal protein S20
MANTPSAKKRILQTAKRTAVNAARKSRIRTFIRKVEEAIRGGDAEAARAALRDAQPEIMRGASRGVLHANTASRKVARLAHRVKVMQAV